MSQKRLFTSAPREPEPLTFLSNGGGQDSTALLLRLVNEPDFRRRYAPGRLISITADTGNEHRLTLYNLVRMRRLCREHDIEFFFVTARYGHHVGDWQSLQQFYESGSRIGSKSYPKSCSHSLKLQPLYKFLCAYLSEHYGVSSTRKDGLYEYTALTGEPVTALIGISAEETSRRLDPAKNTPPGSPKTSSARTPWSTTAGPARTAAHTSKPSTFRCHPLVSAYSARLRQRSTRF